MKVTKKRTAELLDLAAYQLSLRESFEYYDWDGFIECDELLTPEELDWMRDNFIVEVIVRKVDAP